MKKIKLLSLLMLVALTIAGCKNKNPEPGPNPGPQPLPGGAVNVVGEWHISTFEGEVAPFDVYLAFAEDGSFAMYQRLYTLTYALYEGTYNVAGDILTGSYTDGQNWKCGYKAELSADGKTLTLYSQEDVSLKTVYTKTTIPDSVKDEAAATRATDSERFL